MKNVFVLILLLTFGAWATNATRYVNTASAGGNGTTNETSGANAAFATLNAFRAAPPAVDTVTCYCSGSTADVTAVELNDFDATDVVNIIGDNATGKWDNNYYHIVTNNANALTIYDEHIRLKNIQITVENVASAVKRCIYVAAVDAGSDVLLDGCILYPQGVSDMQCLGVWINDADATLNVINSVIYMPSGSTSLDGDNSGIRISLGTANIYSSTVIGGYHGIYNAGGTVVAKNCYVHGVRAAGYDCYSGTITKTTCASSDATGTAGLQSIAYATASGAEFTNVSDGTQNLHIAATSDLVGVGTDTHADAAPFNFTIDIDGDDRGATWDIGADQYASSCTPPTLSYATSPIIDTVGVSGAQAATVGESPDSIAAIDALPAGLSMTKTGENIGNITGTPTTASAKAGYTIRAYKVGCESVDAEDTITVTWGIIYLDSIAPDSGNAGDTVIVYGRGYGNTQGASTIDIGDSTPTVVSWSNTSISLIVPDFPAEDTFDFVVSDGSTSDTIADAFWYQHALTSFTLTMVNSTPAGTISPVAGTSEHDSAAAVNLTYVAPQGYRFWKWTRSNLLAIIIDSTSASTTLSLKGNSTITAVDSILKFTLTMANDAHSTSTPAAGASSVDTIAATAITNIGAVGYRFWKWTRSNATAVFGDSSLSSTTVALKENTTITSNDSIIHYVLTMAVGQGGTTTPSVGASSVDSFATTNISHVSPQGYRFRKWTRSSTNAVFGDSSTNSTTVALKAAATITAVDSTMKVVLTIVNASGKAGIPIPEAGANVLDSGAVTPLSFVAPDGWGFSGWTASNSDNIVFNDDSSEIYLKANVTLTASDTATNPDVPILVSPDSADSNVSKSVTFTWGVQALDTAYIIDVSLVSNFSTLVSRDTVLTTSKAKTLESDTTVYYWRVKGGNAVGWSAYSSVWWLMTEDSNSSAAVGVIIGGAIMGFGMGMFYYFRRRKQ